jgi:glutamyl/glutaminyl-tRNA synthetase
MPNKWILHVQNYAKQNNLTYACALSQPNIKDGYEKVIKKSRKQINEEKIKLFISQNIEMLKNKIKNMKDDEKPIIRMKVNSYNKTVRDGLKEKYPNLWEKLFS